MKTEARLSSHLLQGHNSEQAEKWINLSLIVLNEVQFEENAEKYVIVQHNEMVKIFKQG